jgi:DNA polymerase-1
MKFIVIDSENTGAQRNKAHWADRRNRCCTFQFCENNQPPESLDIEYQEGRFFDEHIELLKKKIEEADWIVGFNLKYDSLWLLRYGIDIRSKKLWDVQLVFFIMTFQKFPFPSLNMVAEHYGFEKKLDVVSSEYWDVGLDTDQVPWDILTEYGEYDVDLTRKCALEQFHEMRKLREDNPNLYTTIRLAMRDMRSLITMEWNGVAYDRPRSYRRAEELQARILLLQQRVLEITGAKEYEINFGSTHQRSILLYGGVLRWIEKEEYEFLYKDPKKQPVKKLRNVEKSAVLPRQFNPIPGTEIKADFDCWSTDEDTLRKLAARSKEKKEVINCFLEMAKLNKLVSTYYLGFPKRNIDMGWTDDVIHSNLSQTTVVTGRLASSKPNLQNIPAVHKECFPSSFPVRKRCRNESMAQSSKNSQ